MTSGHNHTRINCCIFSDFVVETPCSMTSLTSPHFDRSISASSTFLPQLPQYSLQVTAKMPWSIALPQAIFQSPLLSTLTPVATGSAVGYLVNRTHSSTSAKQEQSFILTGNNEQATEQSPNTPPWNNPHSHHRPGSSRPSGPCCTESQGTLRTTPRKPH